MCVSAKTQQRQAPCSPKKRWRVTSSYFKGISYCIIKDSPPTAWLFCGTSACASKCPQHHTSSMPRGVTQSENLLSYAARSSKSTPPLPSPAKPGKPGKVTKRQESSEAQASPKQKASFQPLPLVLQLLDRCSLYSSISSMTSNREAWLAQAHSFSGNATAT